MRVKRFIYQETTDRADVYSFHLSLMDGGIEIFIEAKFYPSGDIVLVEPTELHLKENCRADIIDLLMFQYSIYNATPEQLKARLNGLLAEYRNQEDLARREATLFTFSFDDLEDQIRDVRKALKNAKGKTNGRGTAENSNGCVY